jgi:hypothetical protein
MTDFIAKEFQWVGSMNMPFSLQRIMVVRSFAFLAMHVDANECPNFWRLDRG